MPQNVQVNVYSTMRASIVVQSYGYALSSSLLSGVTAGPPVVGATTRVTEAGTVRVTEAGTTRKVEP